MAKTDNYVHLYSTGAQIMQTDIAAPQTKTPIRTKATRFYPCPRAQKTGICAGRQQPENGIFFDFK